ncbi:MULTISPECIES: hypothetical protein [unclassified Marinovum]|uniref:hypothetical protein n=1 Tax=unclassified Marinovum TaxID=2647166 RepID=UPI003EDC234C
MDKITESVVDALGQSRLVRKCLDEKIIALLDPAQQSFASEISKRITAGSIISETFLRDLEAFIVLLHRLAGDETTYAWRGHEHDPACGYRVPVPSQRASVFYVVLEELVDLASDIEGALDAARAYAIANALFET